MGSSRYKPLVLVNKESAVSPNAVARRPHLYMREGDMDMPDRAKKVGPHVERTPEIHSSVSCSVEPYMQYIHRDQRTKPLLL